MLSIGRRARKVEDNVETLRAYVEQLQNIPFLNGQPVGAVIPAGSTFAEVRHSLDRPYLGALIVGMDAFELLVVLSADRAEAAGVDVSKFLVVLSDSPVVQDTTVNLWVF